MSPTEIAAMSDEKLADTIKAHDERPELMQEIEYRMDLDAERKERALIARLDLVEREAFAQKAAADKAADEATAQWERCHHDLYTAKHKRAARLAGVAGEGA